ncbi:MAG: NAD(P)-dependent oxidoreductase [Blastocatellia bacterium]
MTGSAPTMHIQISVFDRVIVAQDFAAQIIRTYTFVNVVDSEIIIDWTRKEEFDPPVRNFQCSNPSSEVQILPFQGEETGEVSWILGPRALQPGDQITVQFSFERHELFKVLPPLIGTFEYSSLEHVIYSVEVIPELSCLFEYSEIQIIPDPMDVGKSSFVVTQDGRLVSAPRRLSANRGGEFSLRVTSSPPRIETLPLIQILANEAKNSGISIADLTLIIVPHLLTDFLSFADALEAIGVNPERTFIVGIPYSLKQHVVLHLLHRGYKSIWAPTDYPFIDKIDEAIQAAAASVKSNGGRILIIEDGGYIVPRLHTHYPELIDYVIGAVEQTANGIWAYRTILSENRRIRTVNVAECDLKKRRESPLIGDAVFMNVSRLLEKVQLGLRDKRVLIVGYGATGSRVAEVFSKNGAKVTVIDNKEDRREKAKQDSYDVADNLETAIKGKFLIVGCTGEEIIGMNALLSADHQTYFVNASSKRLEVNHRDLLNITRETELLPGFGTKYHLINGRDITILANGFPVNFHGKAESVPDKELQFIYGLLLDSAVYLVKTPDLPVGIIDVPNENQEHIEELHNHLLP